MHSRATAPAASSAGSFFFSRSGARIRAYVDGLNLFYGALKGRDGLKWLDLVALCDALSGGQPVDHVRYFNASVSGRWDPGRPRRQAVYIRASAADARFTYHPGKFRSHLREVVVENPMAGCPTTVTIWRTEEKQSDVNLGTMLLVDGIDGLYDEAIVITNDSDLTMPIRVASERFGPVHVFRPTREHLNDLADAASTYVALPSHLISACQLPPLVRLANGRVLTRPVEWS